MKEKHIGGVESKEIFYEELEGFAREKIREHLQDLLEQEVSEWLGREKSERKVNILEQPGYRNGYGKTRRFTMSLGTMEIQRPRVRDLGERFKSKILPMFKRQSKQVRELIPELYLHGLASGDFELALRHLLGEGAPLSASSLQRLKEKWRGEYEQWKSTTIEEKDWAYLWADGIYVKAGLGKEKGGVAGGDRGPEERQQAVFSAGAWVSREQGVVGRSSPPAQNPRSEKCPGFRWRWELGVMGGGWRSVSPGRAAAVLESQDAQRDGCRKQEGTNRGQKTP